MVVSSGAEGNAIVNYAACFASAAGGSEGCGRAVWEWSDCYARVCDYSPITVCGGTDKYNSINNVCRSSIDTARALCAAGP